MRRCEIALGCFLAMTAVRCGGSPPVAQTPEQRPVDSAAPAAELPSGPEPPPSQELAAGIKAFDAANYPEARSSFEAAAKKNPNNYEALYDLGMTCEKLADKPAAEAAYKAALVVKPDL